MKKVLWIIALLLAANLIIVIYNTTNKADNEKTSQTKSNLSHSSAEKDKTSEDSKKDNKDESSKEESDKDSSNSPSSHKSNNEDDREDTGSWEVKEVTSDIDDSKNVLIAAQSINPVEGRFGRSSYPALIMACRENKTSLYIAWNTFIDTRARQVLYRLDKEPAHHINMPVSTDHKSTGLWNGVSSIPFIKKMLDSEKLLVRVTPYGENPITAKYDLKGLENAIKPLKKSCNW